MCLLDTRITNNSARIILIPNSKKLQILVGNAVTDFPKPTLCIMCSKVKRPPNRKNNTKTLRTTLSKEMFCACILLIISSFTMWPIQWGYIHADKEEVVMHLYHPVVIRRVIHYHYCFSAIKW